MKKAHQAFILGIGMVVLGAVVVEGLLLGGLRPLAPLGWPGICLLAATAFGGAWSFAGGALALLAYYALNLGAPWRFPEFYAHPYPTLAWTAVLVVLASVVLAVRRELAMRRKYEAALRASQAELRAQRERLDAALDGSNVAFWDADLRNGRVYLSEAWAGIVGEAQGETVAELSDLAALMHPDDVEPAVRASVEAMKGLRPAYAAEHRVRATSGEWKWVLSRGRVTERDAHTGRAVRMVGTNVDITERKRLEQAMQSAAHTDPLTGLANRMLLDERLRLAVARSRRNGAGLAVLYLDIDRFKTVNDRFGHLVGDALLKQFATRLRSCLRAADTVARLGGDEFVVLLEDLKERNSAELVAEKILQAMRTPMHVDGHELTVTASIGVICGDANSNEQTLLARADRALYEAKAAGRNTSRMAAGV